MRFGHIDLEMANLALLQQSACILRCFEGHVEFGRDAIVACAGISEVNHWLLPSEAFQPSIEQGDGR